MFNRESSACFQDIVKANQIRTDISIRVLNGIAYAGLGSQVYNHMEMMILKKRMYYVSVSNTTANK